MDVKTEKIVETYIKVRDAISEMEAKHKQEKKSLQEQIDILEKALLERCEEARRVSRNYWTNDWESLYRIVKEHDAFHLLHQRISNKAMQEFLEEHPDLLPEGMNVDSRYAVTVTRRS
jgi:predicted RNase H-like nuclease